MISFTAHAVIIIVIGFLAFACEVFSFFVCFLLSILWLTLFSLNLKVLYECHPGLFSSVTKNYILRNIVYLEGF